MFRRNSITILFLFLFGSIFGQMSSRGCTIDYPKSVCISLNENGDVALNWPIAIDNDGVFLNYELYSTESPFVPFITHNKIDSLQYRLPALYSNNHFFLKTTILCNGSPVSFVSDTVEIINLKNVKVDEGIEKLMWSSAINYNTSKVFIERITTNSVWKTIDSSKFNTSFYLDTVDICNKNLLTYRVGVQKLGCISYSNLVSDTLKDMYHPNIPVIRSIGFDTVSEQMLIKWNKPKERDVQGYIIYQDINNLSTTLDTVLHNGNTIDTFYIIYNPSLTNISNYRIAAFDYCYSIPPKFQTSAQSALFQSTLLKNEYNVCTKEINLFWNEILTNDDITKYRVFTKKNTKPWTCIDSISDRNYRFYLEKFIDYSIVIELETKDGYKSFSSVLHVFAKSPSEPKISFTNYASVVNDREIEIKHTIEKTPGLQALVLFKKTPEGIFEEIEKKLATSNTIYFTDKNVFPKKFSYEYYIQHVDSCGNYTAINLIQQTIKTEENTINQDTLSLSFIVFPYNGFLNKVNYYQIKKSYDGINFFEYQKKVSDSSFIITDDFYKMNDFSGHVCYSVEAVELESSHEISKSSSANICFDFDPKIYIPNAFTPDGQNPIFKPVVSVFEITSYDLTILNRWGQPVFQTYDENIGWNGNFGNENAPNGLYVYLLKVNTGSDKEIIKRGLVNLIR
jgi:gliding motility-associated-like protein